MFRKILNTVATILGCVFALFGFIVIMAGNSSERITGIYAIIIGAFMIFGFRYLPDNGIIGNIASKRKESKSGKSASYSAYSQSNDPWNTRYNASEPTSSIMATGERLQNGCIVYTHKYPLHRLNNNQNQQINPPTIRYNALSLDDALNVHSYAVVDVETTGLNPQADEIIEIAIIRNIDGQLSTYQSFVRPWSKIPAEITQLTGIRNADVRRAPRIYDVVPQVSAFIGNLPIVAHNAPFDVKFIATAFKSSGLGFEVEYIDTVQLARLAFPRMKNYKLATLIDELGLARGGQQHRAGSDTDATFRLFELCREKIPLQQAAEQREKEQAEIEDKAYHLNQYGMQAEAHGDVDKAISYYEDIVSDGAILPNAYMRLAIIYKKRQQWADVVRVCNVALDILNGTLGRLCQPDEYEKRRAYAMEKLGADPNEKQ